MYSISMDAREMWGGLPRKVCASAQDSWQVLMFEGQTCSHSRAFTRSVLTLEECVLVDSKQHFVEIYRREQDKHWVILSFGPAEQVELASLGTRSPLEALYEGVLFPEDRSISRVKIVAVHCRIRLCFFLACQEVSLDSVVFG